VTRDHARKLNLTPMVSANEAPLQTAFTVSIDYRHGLTTGISAEERCSTVRALTNPNTGAGDFVRPGHVFPLIAKDGGVLTRSGHTEAAIDLCRMTGQAEVGVLAELVNDNGTVMRGPEVAAFAAANGLKVVSVADLIAYRQRNDRLVKRLDSFDIETPAGRAKAYSYETPFDPMHQLAVVWGDIRDGRDVPVRLHLENIAGDVFGRAASVRKLIDRFDREGRGIIVYLREGAVGVSPASIRPRDAIAGAGGQSVSPETLQKAETEGHSTAAVRAEEWREIGLGAQILKDLGVSSIRLISSRPRRYVGLEGFGIAISATEGLD
jgi:3,4-dihydroxy 2-butanone 4-phosphate synthase/GTP cyclohydrolase II